MKVRKLLFVLTNIFLISTPLISVVACKSRNEIEIIPKAKGNLALITEITPLVSDIYAFNLFAAEPNEIKDIFQKTAFRIVNSLPNAKGSKEGTDYFVEVKTRFGEELTFTTDLTTTDEKIKTFQVTINSINTSLRLVNQTAPILSIIPTLDKVDLNQIKAIENVDSSHYQSGYFENLEMAKPSEIQDLIANFSYLEILTLGGLAANAKIEVDFLVNVSSQDGTPLNSTYDLTKNALTCQVVIVAVPTSLYLTGETNPPLIVVLPALN